MIVVYRVHSTIFLLILAARFVQLILTMPPHGEPFFIVTLPKSFLILLPAIYIFFVAAEFINEHSSKILNWFNSFNAISYIAMIIQHVVIYSFADAFDFRSFRLFGVFYILFVVTITIVLLSQWLKKFSDAAETLITKRG